MSDLTSAENAVALNDLPPIPLPQPVAEPVNESETLPENPSVRTPRSDAAQTPAVPPAKKSSVTLGRANYALALVLFAFAVAAYIAQRRGNDSSDTANKIALKTYNEQLWKDCRDRSDVRDSDVCKTMLAFDFDTLYSLESRSLDMPPANMVTLGSSYLRPLEQLKTPSVFVIMMLAHIIFLFPLRDLLSGVRARSRPRNPLGQYAAASHETVQHATITEYVIATITLVVWLTAIIIAVQSLKTGLTGDLACTYILILLLSSMIVFEPAMQRLRLQAFPEADYPLSAVAMQQHPSRVSVVELAGSIILWMCRKINIKPWKRS